MSNWSILYDTATGRRAFRSVVQRARSRMLPAARWVAEFVGVALVAAAAWIAIAPAAALAVGGLYVIIAANAEQD